MRFLDGVDETGAPIELRDPLADALRAAQAGAATPEGRVRALLDLREVFGADLSRDPRFREAVTGHYLQLCETGARRAMAAAGG
jgi:fructuronate reductase